MRELQLPAFLTVILAAAFFQELYRKSLRKNTAAKQKIISAAAFA
jgi:hypothetical protein